MKYIFQKVVFAVAVSFFYAFTLSAQIRITGTVNDDTGAPMPGVNVVVKGTNTGQVTNVNGQYSIAAPDGNAVLVFSSVGFATQEITVGNQQVVNVSLAEDTQQLDEVVVIGYGTQRKRDVAGSIAVVSGKDLGIQSVSNIQNLFQGRLAGVSVSTSGVPGDAPSIRVRGVGTLGNNTPLYVIDGLPTKSDIAAQINPSSIESVQVLKDAASASIYGAQAANGVILITTKQGKEGKAEVDIKVNKGIQLPTNLPEMLNSQQYGEVLWNAMRNAGLTPTHQQYGNGPTPVIPDYILPNGVIGEIDLSNYNTGANQYMRANKEGTNWAEEVYRPAQTTNLDISARGGSADSKYFISANYGSQDALVNHAGYDRVALRGNSQFSILENIKLGTNLSATYGRYKGARGTGDAVLQPALVPVYDVMGNWAGPKGDGLGDLVNQVAEIYNQKDNQRDDLDFLGNIFLEVNFLQNFQFKTTAGANLEHRMGKAFYPTTYWNKGDKNRLVNSMSENRRETMELVWNNTLTYSKVFKDAHSINVLLGTEALSYRRAEINASRTNFAVEDVDYRYLDAGELSKDNNGYGSAYALFSLFTRINYQYQDKYYLSGILRRDGSSRFGANNRYGYFPGVSAAWRISEESFMDSQNILNDLKLRASYGLTGNSEIGNYAFATTYYTNLSGNSYPIAGEINTTSPGISRETQGNQNIRWETTTQTNLGVDAVVLDNRLAFSLDWYHKYTYDILQRVTYPATGGRAQAPYENIGEMTNNGLELSANYRNTFEQKDFTYDIGLILSGYRNHVTSLASNQFISGTYNRTAVGMPISSFYGFVVDGIFQDQAEVDAHATQTAKAIGRWKYRDVDGNGTITDADRTYIGNPHPKFEFALNSRLYYKNFDLNVFIQGTYGNQICFASKFGQYGTDVWGDSFNKSTRLLDTWTVDNRDATLPEINSSNPNNENTRVSSFLIENGSYMRLKFLELGYTISPDLLSKINVKGCRIYLNAENLLTLTKYNNMDPEVNSGDDLNKGIDSINDMPLARIFSVGFNFTF